MSCLFPHCIWDQSQRCQVKISIALPSISWPLSQEPSYLPGFPSLIKGHHCCFFSSFNNLEDVLFLLNTSNHFLGIIFSSSLAVCFAVYSRCLHRETWLLLAGSTGSQGLSGQEMWVAWIILDMTPIPAVFVSRLGTSSPPMPKTSIGSWSYPDTF